MNRIAFQLLKIARIITALDDLDFKRFKAIFDSILRNESVDVEAVGKCNGKLYSEASVNAQQSVDSIGLSEEDKSEIAKEALKVWSNDVRPILLKIDDFMRKGTWNILEANSIWKEISVYESKKHTSFVLGILGGIMLSVDDYIKAFSNAAETYLTSSFESIDNSGFQEALEDTRQSIEGGIRNLGAAYKEFSERLKSGIESLRSSEMADAKGDSVKVFKALSEFDKNLDTMRVLSANFGGLFNVFFNYFIGRSSNDALYDLNRWRKMLKEFKKRFDIIPSSFNSMLYSIDKFLMRHGKDNVISGSGRDPKALYRDDAIRCYESLKSDYINIIRSLGDSGIVFDLDSEMSELERSIEAM